MLIIESIYKKKLHKKNKGSKNIKVKDKCYEINA